MNNSTQDAHWRHRMLTYCEGHGLKATSIRYRMSRKSVWKWRCRWDGTWESVAERSRRPHHSPRGQSPGEEKLVRRYARKYPGDLLLGVPESKRIRVRTQLRVLQAHSGQAAEQARAKEEEETKAPALRAGGLPRAEDPDGREVCAGALRHGREEVLPVHGCICRYDLTPRVGKS